MKTWTDCNQALHEMAQLDVEIQQAEVDRGAALREIQEAYELAAGRHVVRRGELEKDVEKFAVKKRGEICKDGKKSIELNFGSIEFRLTGKPKLVFLKDWDEAKALAEAKAKLTPKLRKLIIRPGKESIDKTAAKKLDAAQLKVIGMEVEDAAENVTIKTFPERLG